MPMKIAIMEPYFFPYLGHFDLINSADAWIAFDLAQYTRHRFGNRNRILHPSLSWQYIIVPVLKHSQKTPFCEIQVANQTDWRGRILRQLAHYEKYAPYYAQVIDFVEECLEECYPDPKTHLAKFTTAIFHKVCRRLGLQQPVHLLSELELKLGPVEGPGDWGLRVCQAVGADEFINPCGGACILDPGYYWANGVKLTFQSYKYMVYDTGKYQFEPNLSIIDVMMWNTPEEIKHYLDTYHLLSVTGRDEGEALPHPEELLDAPYFFTEMEPYRKSEQVSLLEDRLAEG